MTDAMKSLAQSGIEGLDDVLQGGLPRGGMYLVKGNPGVGKTTLALQFVLAGQAAGETGLYITLSETQDELRAVAASHGWSLDGIALLELNAKVGIPLEGEYTMYHPSEVELREAMSTLLEGVDRVGPTRVVFDSLSEIRLLAGDALRYRRQVLALKRHFAGKNCTVLLLDDHSGDADHHLESLAHGVVSLERHSPVYGGARRRLEIVKLRGVQFRDGYHDYTIERGGIRVYPRLVAAEHRSPVATRYQASGLAALDELTGGGLNCGTATLVMGPAGSGKSVLSTTYAIAAAQAGHNAIIFTFDEAAGTAITRAEALGLPVKPLIDAGTLRIVQVDPVEMSPGQFAHGLRAAVERDHALVVVIDSLTGYLNSMPEEQFLVNQLHELLAFLGNRMVVTLLVATQHGLIGTAMNSPVDVSYLADTVILLRYFEAAGSVRNAISVVKRRTGPHERTLREFRVGVGGVHIGAPLREFHGVLSGTPTYVGASRPLFGDAGDPSQ
jgi:circadian clock protein KaiC